VASLTIRKLDDSIKAKLRVRAAENGRSMEEEARAILETAVASRTRSKSGNFYESIRGRLAEAGIEGAELEIAPREPAHEPIDLGGSEYGSYDDE
jgi:plasmid stability protein